MPDDRDLHPGGHPHHPRARRDQGRALTPLVDVLAWALFLGVLVAAAASDLKARRIPNLLPFLLFAGFVAVALVQHSPVIGAHLAAGAGTVAVVLGLYLARALGGGDVKLLAAIAFWFTPQGLLLFVLLLSLLGGIYAAVLLVARRLRRTDGPPDRRMPYAPAIAAAAAAAALLAPINFLA